MLLHYIACESPVVLSALQKKMLVDTSLIFVFYACLSSASIVRKSAYIHIFGFGIIIVMCALLLTTS